MLRSIKDFNPNNFFFRSEVDCQIICHRYGSYLGWSFFERNISSIYLRVIFMWWMLFAREAQYLIPYKILPYLWCIRENVQSIWHIHYGLIKP